MFSISQLEQFSGIKAHTIRIWELRYGALKPSRSEGNTRYYDDSQLKRLLNIVSLMKTDHKISQLCLMTDKQHYELLNEQLQNNLDKDETIEYYISQLITAGMTYDESYFEKIFSNALLRYGMKDVYIKIIYPVLVRIGLMWRTGKLPPSHEHFISNIIRQKMFAAIDALPPAQPSKDTWLLYLPKLEFHEIGLLFAHYTIRKAGKRSIYLGANVPVELLESAVNDISPSNILVFYVQNSDPTLTDKYFSSIVKIAKGIQIHVSGNLQLISKLKTRKNFHWIKSVTDLELQLK